MSPRVWLQTYQVQNRGTASVGGYPIIKGDARAQQIMSYFYPKSKNLAKETITNSRLEKYANLKKSTPTATSDTLTSSEVKAQINGNRPIYLGAAGSDTYKKARHALVLRSYSDTAYSVWNPWNKSYVSKSKSTKSISETEGKLT